MSINLFEIMASLRIGLDLETLTPASEVPHTTDPSHIPAYTLRTDDGLVVAAGGVVELTDRAHWNFDEPVTLFEDEYAVFCVG